jgi:hypothetical protein
MRLGQAEHWPWGTVEEVYDHCLEPVGLTFQELVKQYGFFGNREYRRYKQFSFGTPSGKVEFPSILSPARIGPHLLKNRLVALPVFTGFTHPEGQISSLLIKHYNRLSNSGVAMVTPIFGI